MMRNGKHYQGPSPVTPDKVKTSRRKKLKRFLILELVQTLEAESEEAARERVESTFPKSRVFRIVEVSNG